MPVSKLKQDGNKRSEALPYGPEKKLSRMASPMLKDAPLGAERQFLFEPTPEDHKSFPFLCFVKCLLVRKGKAFMRVLVLGP